MTLVVKEEHKKVWAQESGLPERTASKTKHQWPRCACEEKAGY